MRRAVFLVLLSVTLGLAASARPADALLNTLHQTMDIAIVVNVGVTPAPTAVPSAAAGATESIDASVGAPPANGAYFEPSATTIVFNGNPGDTVTEPCAEQLTFASTDMEGDMESILDNAFVELGGTATMPTTALQFQVSPNWPSWTGFPDYATDGKSLFLLGTTLKSPICINLQMVIPSSAAPGTYYAVMPLAYFTIPTI